MSSHKSPLVFIVPRTIFHIPCYVCNHFLECWRNASGTFIYRKWQGLCCIVDVHMVIYACWQLAIIVLFLFLVEDWCTFRALVLCLCRHVCMVCLCLRTALCTHLDHDFAVTLTLVDHYQPHTLGQYFTGYSNPSSSFSCVSSAGRPHSRGAAGAGEYPPA